MRLYVGNDLHSNNNYLGIIDEKGRKVHKEKLPNELSEVLRSLEPYRDNIEGIVDKCQDIVYTKMCQDIVNSLYGIRMLILIPYIFSG
jgi:hypothetical protein